MKHYTHKLTALLLAALIMVSPIAQYACAEEAVYYTETKYPLLADVRGQLDEDEIVAAYDVVINMGDYFNPADVSAFKVEKTNQPTDKVDVSFFSAHASCSLDTVFPHIITPRIIVVFVFVGIAVVGVVYLFCGAYRA